MRCLSNTYKSISFLPSMLQVVFAQPVFTLYSERSVTNSTGVLPGKWDGEHPLEIHKIGSHCLPWKKKIDLEFLWGFFSLFLLLLFKWWSWKSFHPLIKLLSIKLEFWTYKNVHCNFTPFIIVVYSQQFLFFNIRKFSLSLLWKWKRPSTAINLHKQLQICAFSYHYSILKSTPLPFKSSYPNICISNTYYICMSHEKMNHPYLPLWSLLFTSANHAELKHTH